MEDKEIKKLDKELTIKYANDILPKINEIFEEYGDEHIELDEFLLALAALVPQAVLENVGNDSSLLEINQHINALLFDLK